MKLWDARGESVADLNQYINHLNHKQRGDVHFTDLHLLHSEPHALVAAVLLAAHPSHQVRQGLALGPVLELVRIPTSIPKEFIVTVRAEFRNKSFSPQTMLYTHLIV